jgi:hypothetical protein
MGKWYKISGYVILLISCVLWGLIAIIPFLGYSKKEIAAIITILIIAGEVTFYLSIIILGKTILNKIKSFLLFWKKKKEDGRTDIEDKHAEQSKANQIS